MLRALAVDDERPSLEELLYLLSADPRIAGVEGAGDATEALRRINRSLESGPEGPDAIALAIRVGTTIYAEEAVLAEAGVAIPDEQESEVEKFREFLDQVSPEDFETGS